MATNEAPGGELTTKQAKALTHLLHEPTLEKAAIAAGIGESTLLRWMKEDAFAVAYRDARRAVVSHSIVQLQGVCGVAVSTLREIAADGNAPASSRVSAARAILDLSLRAVEIEDISSRIETMEARLSEIAASKELPK